jgi:16S rRNA (cytosine1402-N4)-methyltransferase
MNKHPHVSILLQEWLQDLKDKQLTYYIDATLGAGGHSEGVLKEHPELKALIGIDQDTHALKIAEERLQPWKSKLILIHENFSDLKSIVQKLDIGSVDGILIDLGVSSMQLDEKERGFSFGKEGPLDMRMNQEGNLTAADIVNDWSEQEIGTILRDYGEERKWRQAAKEIVSARKHRTIETTLDLVDVLKPVFPAYNKKGVHPMTLVFQGLRIAVNEELKVLENVLPQAIEALSPGGLLGVISFHSLEDRIVKNVFRLAASTWDNLDGPRDLANPKDPTIKLVHKKPLIPSDEEMRRNTRSRSAKLRIVEKI